VSSAARSSIVGGAVRRYLAAKGETPTEPLVCGVPVDLRKGEVSVGGNDFGFLAVTLGAHIDHPAERLRRVHESTSNARQMQHAIGARELSELSARLPGALSSIGFKTLASAQLIFGNRLPVFNVGVSNVPGRRHRCTSTVRGRSGSSVWHRYSMAPQWFSACSAIAAVSR
jgi:diacylglycerol O-acyltransferase / wax synthase